ncbi:ankyrin, partial [Rhizoclosmatium globosum]
ASSNGKKEAVEILLHFGANINASAFDGHMPIHGAAIYGNMEVVEVLIRHATETASNTLKWTPLHVAIARRSRSSVEALIAANFNVNAVDAFGRMPIHLAALHGGFACALLVDAGADINAVSEEGKTPLDYILS